MRFIKLSTVGLIHLRFRFSSQRLISLIFAIIFLKELTAKYAEEAQRTQRKNII